MTVTDELPIEIWARKLRGTERRRLQRSMWPRSRHDLMAKRLKAHLMRSVPSTHQAVDEPELLFGQAPQDWISGTFTAALRVRTVKRHRNLPAELRVAPGVHVISVPR